MSWLTRYATAAVQRQNERLTKQVQQLSSEKQALSLELDAVKHDAYQVRRALVAEQQTSKSTARSAAKLVESIRDIFVQKILELENNLALAVERADKLEADLGRERDDARAFKRRWAGHLNRCAVADEIDQEDLAKARSNQ